MIDSDTSTSSKPNRYVYRGLSPTSESRLNHRLKELEENLDFERNERLRAERNSQDLQTQVDILSEQLNDASGISSQVSLFSNSILPKGWFHPWVPAWFRDLFVSPN